MLKEFRDFAMRGNVVDMAVGIIIGGAFGTIVQSLVADVLMPPIGVLLGGVDFGDFLLVLKQGATPGPYATLADANTAGAVTINYGVFFNALISFLIVAFAVFLLVKGVNSMTRRAKQAPESLPPVTKVCSFCCTAIPVKATRCPHCTSTFAT